MIEIIENALNLANKAGVYNLNDSAAIHASLSQVKADLKELQELKDKLPVEPPKPSK